MTQIIATKSINMGREKLPHITTTICINLNLLMILEAHAPRSEKIGRSCGCPENWQTGKTNPKKPTMTKEIIKTL